MRMKIRPATTGDTAKGRSISVISRLLPLNSNLAMAQAAATPNRMLKGSTASAMTMVSQIAERVSDSFSASR